MLVPISVPIKVEGSERIGSETIPIKGSDNIFDFTLPDLVGLT